MEVPFDEVELRDRLLRLPAGKAIAFGLAICERMLPSFASFAGRTGHSGFEVLRASLDRAWLALETGTVPPGFGSASEEAYAVAPDTDDFGDIHTSAALDAASSISLAVNSFMGDAAGKVLEIATLARDTVDMLAQVTEGMDPADPNLEERIASHPLMRAELRRQREDIEFLEELGPDAADAAVALRERSRCAPGSILEP